MFLFAPVVHIQDRFEQLITVICISLAISGNQYHLATSQGLQ